MITDIYRTALEAIERGERIAILTVIEVRGSSPGKPGQKMIAYADGRQVGTVGGGALERKAKEAALEMLRRGEGGLLTYALDPDSPDAIGAICGGEAVIAVEVAGPAARILLCGGGHVAHAFARLCGDLGFVYGVVDPREEMLSLDRFPRAAEMTRLSPAEFVERGGLDRYTHLIILTHDHVLDRETLMAVTRCGYSGYVGMIGSLRKWAEVRQSLIDAGVPKERLDSVHCPIGLAIGARNPAEIAVAIAAEIVQGIRRG